MTALGVAIGIHVLGVLWWIGGLAFVTFVVLPLLRKGTLGNVQSGFRLIEGRFAPQVKIAILLVGASGLYMLHVRQLWTAMITSPSHYWYLWGMLIYWTWFVLMLFVLGPSGLLRKLMKGSGKDNNGEKAWKRLHVIHAVLFIIGIVIIFGAVSGIHYPVY